MFGEVCPWKYANPKRKWIIFQPSIFWGVNLLVSGRVVHPQKTYLAWSSGAMFTRRAKLWDDRKKHLRTNFPTKNLRVAPILWFHRLKSKMKIQGKSRDFQSICEELGQNLAEVENFLSQGVVWRTSCRKSRVCLKKKISRVSSNVRWSRAQDSRIRKISTLSTQTSAPKFLDLDTKSMYRNVQKESPFPNPHLWDQIFRVYCQK